MTIKWYVWIPVALGLLVLSFLAGWQADQYGLLPNQELLDPVSQHLKKELPLEKYALPRLAEREISAESAITIERQIETTNDFTASVFSFVTQGKKMTGQINIPRRTQPTNGFPVIVMLRGYVPPEIYDHGIGTRNAAAVYAKNGFVTIAPDFLGYGESDDEYLDTWEGRFIKPLQVAELLASIQAYQEVKRADEAVLFDSEHVGIWAHSNGGQIALATLEITGRAYPTVLWAPVTAPFPYSVAFFSDELPDEGKQQRAWIALFEKEYNAHDFSLSQHLDLLPAAEILLHHGTADDAALIAWSDEFVAKVEAENKRRTDQKKELLTQIATESTRKNELQQHIDTLQEVAITYYRYPGADHNLQPSWQTVMNRDLSFFQSKLTAN